MWPLFVLYYLAPLLAAIIVIGVGFLTGRIERVEDAPQKHEDTQGP